MRGATPEQYHLARWLLAHEAGNHPNPQEIAGAAEAVCQKLGQPLAKMLSISGFDSLLLRALDMSRPQFPFLERIAPEQPGEGFLKGARESAEGNDSHQLVEGFTTLFAQLLWLMVTFMGWDLAMRLVTRVWPEAPLGDSASGAGEARE